MSQEPYFFEVEGRRRDFDFTTFCQEHYNEAATYAQEWLAEDFDDCEVGESAKVQIHVRAGKPERCFECQPMTREELP